MRSRGYIIAASIALLVVAGCGGEKKGKPAPKETASKAAEASLPAGHPGMDKAVESINKAQHANIKTAKKIKISDEVRAKWTGVGIRIIDNSTSASKTLKLGVGETVKLNDKGYKLRIVTLVPDYAVRGNNIESRSNDAKNPAVLVELIEGEKTLSRGWVFRDWADYNSFSDHRFNVVLESVEAKK